MIVASILVPLSFLLQSSDASAPRGQYVEARTASVFAGACHYGGERTTAGREALLAWRIDSGAFAGTDLSGVRIAAALADDENLADAPDAPGARHSVVYVDAHASPVQRSAAVAWLAVELGSTLGEVTTVKSVALRVDFDADAFTVQAAVASSTPDTRASSSLFDLTGALLPNRDCCKMPFDVWYAPFVVLDKAIVGNDATFSFADRDLGRVWSRPGENAAFCGSFGRRATSSASIPSGAIVAEVSER